MKINSKSKNKAVAVPGVDPYLEGLMAKLLERLVGLEKKLDTVIAQTAGKPYPSPEAKQPPRSDRVFYEAICADCHKVCEVPFRPSEDRPVYCKECFAKRRAGGAGKIMNVLETVTPPVRDTPKKAKRNRSAKKTKKKK